MANALVVSLSNQLAGQYQAKRKLSKVLKKKQ